MNIKVEVEFRQLDDNDIVAQGDWVKEFDGTFFPYIGSVYLGPVSDQEKRIDSPVFYRPIFQLHAV